MMYSMCLCSKVYKNDNRHILNYEPVNIQPDLTYEEKPVEIVDSKIQELRNKRVKLVKVIWRNQAVEEATWELEEEMRKNYPELFGTNRDSEDGIP